MAGLMRKTSSRVWGVAVMELFGDICGLEDVDVPKEGLIVAERGYGVPYSNPWLRNDITN